MLLDKNVLMLNERINTKITYESLKKALIRNITVHELAMSLIVKSGQKELLKYFLLHECNHVDAM